MGGCASRPNEFNAKQEPLLSEETTTPQKAEGEIAPPSSLNLESVVKEDNGGEAKKEEPLVDSSEAASKTEEPLAESKPAAEAEAAVPEESAKPTEDKLVEAAVETKEPPPKEEEKKEVKVQDGDAPLVNM